MRATCRCTQRTRFILPRIGNAPRRVKRATEQPVRRQFNRFRTRGASVVPARGDSEKRTRTDGRSD